MFAALGVVECPRLLRRCLLEGGESEALSSEISFLVPLATLTSITLFSNEVSFAVNLSEMFDSSDETIQRFKKQS